MGGWNARPTDREAARRMWDAGMSRREIATQLGVSENTLSKWRWQDGWPHRRNYGARPIKTRQVTHALDSMGERVSLPPGRVLYRCPFCTGRSTDPEGHELCQQRERVA